MQAFERNKPTDCRDYTEGIKASTIEYLKEGGDERPLGIFGVEVSESLTIDDQFDVLVDNRNGRGDTNYRNILRDAVRVVGIEQE